MWKKCLKVSKRGYYILPSAAGTCAMTHNRSEMEMGPISLQLHHLQPRKLQLDRDANWDDSSNIRLGRDLP